MRGACRTPRPSRRCARRRTFSRVRLYVDLSARTHRIQSFNKTSAVCCWITAGGHDVACLPGVIVRLWRRDASRRRTHRPRSARPQLCKDDTGTNIANTACIMFNSRGVPIDATALRRPAPMRSMSPTARPSTASPLPRPACCACGARSRRDSRVGAQLMALRSERGTTLIETVIATSLAARRHGRTAVDGGARDGLHREPRAPRSAHHRVRAGQDGATAGAGLHRRRVRTRSSFQRPRRRHRPHHRRQPRTPPRRSTATSTGWRRTATLLGGGTTPPANWFYERVWQIDRS